MKTDNRCLLLMSEFVELEAFYYGGDLIDQRRSFGRVDLLRLWCQYGNDNVDDLVVAVASTRDSEKCERDGCFPSRLSDLQDQYY